MPLARYLEAGVRVGLAAAHALAGASQVLAEPRHVHPPAAGAEHHGGDERFEDERATDAATGLAAHVEQPDVDVHALLTY